MRMEFATPSSIPCCNRSGLVTNRSSPTSWILSPSSLLISDHPCQSSSASPSSIDTMGYLRTQSDQYRTICSGECSDLSDFLNTYLPALERSLLFPSLTKNSLAAGSSAIATSAPGSYPACWIASITSSIASTFDFTDGAKPPSSPTPVLYPRFLRTALSV